MDFYIPFGSFLLLFVGLLADLIINTDEKTGSLHDINGITEWKEGDNGIF